MSYIAVDKSAFDEAIEWVNENFAEIPKYDLLHLYACLLYTSDAADD